MWEPEAFFKLEEFAHKDLFQNCSAIWEILSRIKGYLEKNLIPGIYGEIEEGAFIVGKDIYIGEGTIVEPGAYIKGPTIIGKNCTIRHNAYIRGNVIIGDNSLVGNATELKNAVMMNNAKAPHYNYVGDSILGNNVNLGAGTKLSNLKMIPGNVVIRYRGEVIDTGLRKFGAIIGDNCETGCNSVLNPGTLLSPNCLVYPNTTASGYYPANTIIKNRQHLEEIHRIIK